MGLGLVLRAVLVAQTSYRKEVLALLSCNRKEVLAVSRTQAQVTRNQPQEELLLAGAKRSSCACIIFGLYCMVSTETNSIFHVAILLLSVLIPLLKTMHTLAPSRKSP